jgi:hypothetical protein
MLALVRQRQHNGSEDGCGGGLHKQELSKGALTDQLIRPMYRRSLTGVDGSNHLPEGPQCITARPGQKKVLTLCEVIECGSRSRASVLSDYIYLRADCTVGP